MPGSIRENNTDLRQFVIDNQIRTVLDVGPGRGTYAHVLDGLGLSMDAVEIWRPYIRRYDLTRIYRRVLHKDIREHNVFAYDLVLFGDVLEHMPHLDSTMVWDTAKRQARFVMMSVPIIHYPQEASHGNPYEKHVQEHLTPETVRAHYGPFVLDRVYAVTGTFIAAGEAGHHNDDPISEYRDAVGDGVSGNPDSWEWLGMDR